MIKKLIKILLKAILFLVLLTILIVIVVVEPVFSTKDYKTPLADSTSLQTDVIMLSETLMEKTTLTKAFDKKAEFIFNKSSKLTSEVNYQPYDVKGVEYNNVVVNFKGKNNCGTYVIGAHFDTADDLVGADDNSSGTAGLLELVRLYSENKPVCDLQLVFFNLEEPPYFRSKNMGSYIHAKSLADLKTPVEMMLSLEMIGYFTDEENSQDFPVPAMSLLYSNKGNFISIVGDLSQIGITRFLKKSMRSSTDLPVHSINAPVSIPGIDFSDHLNYWAFDYPAVMITDTAFNRNKNYHTKLDTADKLDYKRMAKVVDGIYYAIQQHMGDVKN